MNNKMPDINIIKKSENGDKFIFEVEVNDKLSKSNHTVFLNKSDYERLKMGDDTPEVLVNKTFKFLLKRESKDAILREFNISQISNYFSEFEEEILG